jgi:hypothetical protein
MDLPGAEDSLLIRTDYSDDLAWEQIAEAIRAPAGEFRAYVAVVSDRRYQGLSAAEVVDLLPEDFDKSFIFIGDETTVRHPEHPVLVVDLYEERGRTFRVIPSQMWSVENNLSIANMDFDEFVDYVEADGVFRGFPDSAG